jgi:hypothetical protein
MAAWAPASGVFQTDLLDRGEEGHGVRGGNQLASAFVRWVLPGTGFEVYGEFGRDDHPWDIRHLILQPDDVSSYLLGFQKVWRSGDDLITLRGETLDTDVSHLALADPRRGQPLPYSHSAQRQGHTQRGQMLSSPWSLGGGGSLLASDYYHSRGRWTLSWERAEQAMKTDRFGRDASPDSDADVVHEFGIESLLFFGRFDLQFGGAGLYNLNRYFEGDAVGIRAGFAVRARP